MAEARTVQRMEGWRHVRTDEFAVGLGVEGCIVFLGEQFLFTSSDNFC